MISTFPKHSRYLIALIGNDSKLYCIILEVLSFSKLLKIMIYEIIFKKPQRPCRTAEKTKHVSFEASEMIVKMVSKNFDDVSTAGFIFFSTIWSYKSHFPPINLL